MTTQQQRTANRKNARLSVGPKTAAGKARAAANAQRHGLAVSIRSDQRLAAEAETLARKIVGGASDAARLNLSRAIAEAQVDLVRIRQARRDLLERALFSPDVIPPREGMKEVKALIRIDELTEQGLPIPIELMRVLARPRARIEEPVKFAMALSDLAGQLATMERYERRALSRRNSAMREFDAECAVMPP